MFNSLNGTEKSVLVSLKNCIYSVKMILRLRLIKINEIPKKNLFMQKKYFFTYITNRFLKLRLLQRFDSKS